jgi:hypothetical protein
MRISDGAHYDFTGIGCGGMIIAQLAANGLRLELFDNERLEQEILKLGIHKEGSELMKEKEPRFLDLIFSRRLEIHPDWMEAIIYEVAKKCEGVPFIHG